MPLADEERVIGGGDVGGIRRSKGEASGKKEGDPTSRTYPTRIGNHLAFGHGRGDSLGKRKRDASGAHPVKWTW